MTDWSGLAVINMPEELIKAHCKLCDTPIRGAETWTTLGVEGATKEIAVHMECYRNAGGLLPKEE